jgi:hypothetical protein
MESLAKAFGVSVSLLAGYLFVRLSPYRQYRAEHLRTDRFALHVFGFSVLCYVAGVSVASVIDFRFHGRLVDIYLLEIAKYLKLEPAVICSLLASPILALFDRSYVLIRACRDPAVREHPWHRLIKKSAAAAVATFIFKCDDEAIRTLHRATFYRKPLMLTLKSGKVYVGTPVKGIGDPSVHANFIKIVPILSGYRDPTTHKVELPTRYRDITSRITAWHEETLGSTDDPLAQDIADLKLNNGELIAIDMQDVGVVILWSEVMTVSLYDENIYRAFQDMGPPKKKTTGRLFGKDGLLARLFLS